MKNKTKFLIAKPDTWYDAGTIAICLFPYDENYDPFTNPPDPTQGGLFVGTRNGKLDEEGCGFDEFEVCVG